MLRIESYVTPIILSYVDKYIKNLKPEDSQVSLWGGDAVFNNLDLRLDVLEQELKLPFSFVNGHIHELRIHVPWTKITSEPIVITINTIECILKLKDHGKSESDTSSQTDSGDPKSPEHRKKQKRQELEAPTSYVHGLISRVINNVSIVCNNFILKYVEDDIVLSINAKTLELQSVDGNWISAFIDLSAEDLMLRNLATLTDLTVCLDKRNASGKIESYQEPLLYRCSLSCRIVRQFESIYSTQPLKTRYDVHCPQLHFSLSDTQLPMFLRLVELVLALYSKQLTYQPTNINNQSQSSGSITGEENMTSEARHEIDDSWSSWMWSMGSALIPIEWEDSENSAYSLRQQQLNGVIHLGIYVQEATWVFKLTESVQENSFCGPAKMHFTPFMKIDQQGSFVSIVVKGLEAVNVQLGVSSFLVAPVSNCICGINDTNLSLSEENSNSEEYIPFVRGGRESHEYLTNSLFDERTILGARELWDYQYIWDNHFGLNSEAAILERTGALGLDLLYVMEIPSDISSDKVSEILVNPEYSNMSEKSLCRVLAGPFEINFTSGFHHRLSAIEYALERYEYLPYTSNSPDVEATNTEYPTEEELAYLEANTGVRTYTLSCLQSSIRVNVAQHPYVDMSVVFNAKKRKRNQKASNEFCMARVMPVPAVVLRVGRSDLELTVAMYPDRLIAAASKLRPPSQNLLNHSHSHLSFKLHSVSLSLENENRYSVFLLSNFSPVFYKKTLLLPHLWKSNNQPQTEYFAEFDKLCLGANMPQLMMVHYLLNSWVVDLPSPEDLKTHSLIEDAILNPDKFPALHLNLGYLEAKLCETVTLFAGMTNIGNLSLSLSQGNTEASCYLMSGPETSPGTEQTENFSSTQKLFKGCFQIPKEVTDESVPTVLTVGILKTSLVIGPQFIEWLKYLPKSYRGTEIKNALFFKKISEIKPQPPKLRKASEVDSENLLLPESSSTSISEARTASRLGFFGRGDRMGSSSSTNAVKENKTLKEKFVSYYYPLIKNLLIHLEIESSTVFLSTSKLVVSSEFSLVNAVHRIYLTRGDKCSLGDTTVLCLPKILLQNSAQKHSLLDQINDVPVMLSNNAWSPGKDKLPWSLSLTNFHVYSLQGYGDRVKLPILKPVNTTATLAVTPKHQGPVLTQIGTVIHLDMSPLDFSGCRRQVQSHVSIVENFLSLLVLFITSPPAKSKESLSIFPKEEQQNAKMKNIDEKDRNKIAPDAKDERMKKTKATHHTVHNTHVKVAETKATDSGVATSPLLGPQLSLMTNININNLTKNSSEEPTNTVPLTDTEDPDEKAGVHLSSTALETEPPVISSPTGSSDSILLTSWVQFTVTRVSATLYTNTGEELQRKLRADIEDLTASFDLHDVYVKLKCQVANFSILHFIKNSSEWCSAEHEGVIATSGDQITRELKIVNPNSSKNSAEDSRSKTTSTSSCSSASEQQPKAHGFLSFTFTMAQCKNIHNKWNQIIKKYLREERFIKECKTPQYLSEVDIRMQQFDCIFYPETLHQFLSVYEPWLHLNLPKSLYTHSSNSLNSNSKQNTQQPQQSTPSSSKPAFGLSFNNKVLPLLYLQTDTIRIFLPSKSSSVCPTTTATTLNAPPEINYPSPDLNVSNLIMMQFDSVLVSPQVDNPLSRIILRQDIYNAAQQAKILGVPGSEVEDRQYQIDFIGFSISTGCWNDLVEVTKGRPRSFSSERLGVRGENPAVEWNNYDPTKDNIETEAILYPLVTKLDTKIIAAPAIVYFSINEETNEDDYLLIGGHSLEINATTQVNVYASLSQTSLCINVVKQINNSLATLGDYDLYSKRSKSKGDVLDSGVDCDVSSLELHKIELKESNQNAWNFVPTEMLITGSKITLTVFEKCFIEGKKVSLKGWQRNKLEQRAKKREKKLGLEIGSTESEPSPMRDKAFDSNNLKTTSAAKSTSHIVEMEDGYEGSEEECPTDSQNTCEPQLRLLPLVFISVSQPHTFLTCQPQHQKLDVSCFDFLIKSVPKGFSIKATELKKLPKPDDYTSSWFETRAGDLHPKTGIPPALLVISAADFLHQPAEIYVEVGRPFRILLSQHKWEQMEHVYHQIDKILPVAQGNSVSLEDLPTPEVSLENTLEDLLKRKTFPIKNISFKTTQISLNMEVTKSMKAKSELHVSLSSMNLQMSTSWKKYVNTSKEMALELVCKGGVKDLQVKTMYHSMDLQSFLKPLTLDAQIKLCWVRWNNGPFVEIKILSEILQLDFSPENLFCIIDIKNYLIKFFEPYVCSAEKKETPASSIPVKPEMEPNTDQESVSSSTQEKITSHISQDDLRAGMFQFVKCLSTSSKEIFPQPYQVVFDKALGMMIWCYPEPRALMAVNIFPVPFVSASIDSSHETVTSVHCALQYYDVIRESFVTYQKFQLSESKLLQLNLPGLSEKRLLAVSTTWRVCIDYREEEMQETLNKGSNVVAPEALALSMKVDSMFSVELLPQIQSMVSIKKINVNLVNNVNLTGRMVPSKLNKFSPDDAIPQFQPFLNFHFDNTCLRTYKWNGGDHIDCKSMLYIYILNYKYLTNNLFLEPSLLSLSINVQEAVIETDQVKPKCIDVNFMTKSMFVHVNQTSCNTISTSNEAWKQTLKVVSNIDSGPNRTVQNSLPVLFLTNYILTNDSTENIRFGQVDTDENLILEARSMHLYSWRSHKILPVLQVCIESTKWKWSNTLHIEKEGIQTCIISNATDVSSKFLMICRRTTPHQMVVTFAGSFSVANIFREDFEIKVIYEKNRSDTSESGKLSTNTFNLKGESISPSLIRCPVALKVRVSGSHSWSGDIPINLESSRDSFNLKIPTKVKKENVFSLCKIYRERLEGGLWRLLVVLSPHFVVRSHLPRALTLHVSSTSVNQQCSIKGRGNVNCLSCDPAITHHLSFQLSPEFEISKQSIPISKSVTEQAVRHSKESIDLCSLIENIFNGPKQKWPYIDPSFVEGDFLFAEQPRIDLQIDFGSLYPQCNTMVIDVRPWAMIVNHTGTEILLQEGESLENVWYISSGIVFAPPKLDNYFSFGVVDSKNEQIFCAPLQLSKEERWYTLKFEGRIPQSGATNISIPLKKQICFITVLSRFEENVQVLHLVPTYSVANATAKDFMIRSLHVHTNESKLDLPKGNRSLQLNANGAANDYKETSLLFWDILENTKPTSFEFICLQIGRENCFAHPITFVNDIKTDLRMNFTLPLLGKSDDALILNEPLIITAHFHDNQIKFVVQEDPFPQMILYNNTCTLLMIGQAALNERGVIEEELDIFCALPSVPPGKRIYYTFPCLSSRFPDISSPGTKQPRLHFSQPEVVNDVSRDETVWSSGIDIDQQYDVFVSIPSYGDVKVHIERINHTSHVFIDPASRVEVSAKDVRSRINQAIKSRPNTPPKCQFSKSNEAQSKINSLIEEENKDELVTSNPMSSLVVDSATSEQLMFDSLANMNVFYFSFICSQFSLVIKDDLTDLKVISEVLRVNVDNVIFHLRPKLNLAERLRALNFKVRNQIETIFFFSDAQIDNQLYSDGNYDFPVIFVRQTPRTAIHLTQFDPVEGLIQQYHSEALFSASLVLGLDGNTFNCCALQSLNIRVKPITFYIEDTIIYSLSDFFKNFLTSKYETENISRRTLKDDLLEEDDDKHSITMKLPYEIILKSNAMSHPIYIKQLTVEEISILLSVHASAKLYIAIEQTPLYFKLYTRQGVITTSYSLGHNFVMHYLSSALFRAGWVVGSLDLLGNPGGFARAVGSGIRDFVQLPYEGILQGPWAFIAGITNGSLSLVKHITAGTLLSVTNLASSVARNMEKLSLDEEHLNRNEALRRLKPSGLGAGISQGLSSFGISLLGAVGGLIHQPLQAVLADGISPTSIVGGFGKGLVGMVTKPIGGAADFVVHTGQGLLQRTGWKHDLEPKIKPLMENHSNAPNSTLKFVWKLLVALPSECRQVVCAADATLITPNKTLSPVTVILTPQVLFILGVDEDAQQHVFSLHELEWKASTSDPYLLYLQKIPPLPTPVPNQDAEPITGCPERVKDYVRSTCSENPESAIHLPSSDDEFELSSKDAVSSRVKLLLAPQWRAYLVSSINIAVRAVKGKGFIS